MLSSYEIAFASTWDKAGFVYCTRWKDGTCPRQIYDNKSTVTGMDNFVTNKTIAAEKLFPRWHESGSVIRHLRENYYFILATYGVNVVNG